MGKKLIIAAIAVAFGFSAPILMEDARLVAENFAIERDEMGRNDMMINLSYTEQNNQTDIFYVFNLSDDGFVIVAAVDNVIPILGYNFNHNFRFEHRAPQFDAMIENFVAQIEYAIENNLSASEKIQQRWQTYLDPNFQPERNLRNVSPLLATNWNQDNPWNYGCPSDNQGPGGHVYAGCVAVSMAQVMKYWEYPETGQGSHSYNCPPYGNLSADFGNATYQWNNMPNNSGNSSATQTLLYHCGVAVEMQYSAEGSGAWIGGAAPSAIHALETYFGYSTDAIFLEKDYYSETHWESMLRDELDNGRPLVYRGCAFNLDGYQGTDYFHLNWGWSGWEDGYYYISNLNPGGMDFSFMQGGIFNLYAPVVVNPTISVSISQIATTLETEQIDTGSFSISNTGDTGSTLTYSISESPSVTWFSVSPTSGSISSGSSNVISYSIGHASLSEGTYSSNLVISNNAGNSITIPVSLTVQAAANPIDLSFDCSNANYMINTTGNELQVLMDNDMNVGGFQFDVTDLPDGLLEFTGVEITNRTADFVFSSSQVNDGFRVIGFSMTGGVIAPGTGAIATLIFSTNAQPDNVEVCINGVVTSDEFGDALPSVAGCCTLAIEQGGIKGDINYDGIINILDVVQTVNFVLGLAIPDDAQFWAADYNSDGILNILDVVQIVNVVLGIG